MSVAPLHFEQVAVTYNGWAQLCGKENMKFGVMGGNHFNMMHAPHAVDLGALIREAVDWKN
jgi:thioesterase domain-containing protein